VVTLKITKSQLKEIISQVVHDNLNKGLEVDDDDEPGMSRDELAAHLAAERDRKRSTDVQRRRADMRRSVRGMELESKIKKEKPMDLKDLLKMPVFTENRNHTNRKSLKEGFDYRDALDEFLYSYKKTALWSSTNPEGDTPLDATYEIVDLTPEATREMEQDAASFMKQTKDLIDYDDMEETERAGHDFWLTRNHHGAGFWDGDWGDERGLALTNISARFPEVNLLPSQNGIVQESKKSMKVSKTQLKGMVRKAIREQLHEAGSGIEVKEIMIDVLRDSGMTDTDILTQLVSALDDQAVRSALGALVSQAQSK